MSRALRSSAMGMWTARFHGEPIRRPPSRPAHVPYQNRGPRRGHTHGAAAACMMKKVSIPASISGASRLCAAKPWCLIQPVLYNDRTKFYITERNKMSKVKKVQRSDLLQRVIEVITAVTGFIVAAGMLLNAVKLLLGS